MPLILRFYIITLFLPFAFGKITSTDVGLLYVFLAILVSVRYKLYFKSKYFFLLLLGIFGIFGTYITNFFFSPKLLVQFASIFILLNSFRSFIGFEVALLHFIIKSSRIISILFLASSYFSPLNKVLSSILMLNRSSNLVEGSYRNANSFLGEPSFAGLIFICFIVLSLLARSLFKTGYSLFFYDCMLYLFSLISTKSLLAIVGLGILLPIPLSAMLASLSRLKITRKLLFSVILALSFLSLLSIFIINNFQGSRFFVVLSNASFDLLLSDSSVMQRFLNIDIFLSNFPFSYDFLLGMHPDSYALFARSYSINSSIDYSSLFLFGHPYYSGQVSALPVVYFNSGVLPTLALIIFLFLFYKSYSSLNSPFSLCGGLFLIFSLFAGPSILFPLGYFLLFVICLTQNLIKDFSHRF